MDVLLYWADEYVLDKAYAYLLPYPSTRTSSLLDPHSFNSSTLSEVYSTTSQTYHPSSSSSSSSSSLNGSLSLLARDNILRQAISLYVLALLGALVLYYLFCSISYYIFFDRRLEYHPRFLKNQIKLEIKSSMVAAPWIDLLTLPWFLGEVRGKSRLYDDVATYGLGYLVFSATLFLVATDLSIYWIHRLEHHPRIYKHIHKPHHKWLVPTPWAALAFHPLDGYAQSLPYHIIVYVIPMHKYLYLGLFVFVQLWTILIHDGDMISGHILERYINSPAHHTLHHLYFTCNYGQYFTWADSYWDSYRSPEPELDPLLDALKVMRKKGLVDEHNNPIGPQDKSE